MLRINKLYMGFLIFGLSLLTGWLSVKSSLADGCGGILHTDYDNSFRVRGRSIFHPYLDVDVWVDKGEGATYYPGEKIKVYFQTSRDCYLVIYNIDTRGYVHLLYPYDVWDGAYVEGGRVYRIPDRFDEYQLTVNGPRGVEYIQAVASLQPLDLPNFPGEYTYEGEIYAYALDGEDPYEFMAEVNAEIAPFDYASDICIFSVEYRYPRWYYWPREVYVDRPLDLIWGGVYFGYPRGVEVWIDGAFYGITPITIPALVVGRHYVSFWFRGCWIWRDWIRIRRDCTITIWPDCYDRYRFVNERFVVKSYRAEKAKRRRGISTTGGLIRPIHHADKRRVYQVENSQVSKEKKFKGKRRGVKDRPMSFLVPSKAKTNKTEKIKTQSIRNPLTPEKGKLKSKRKIKVKKVKTEGKILRKIKGELKFTSFKQPSRVTEKFDKDKSPKPKTRISKKEKRVTKSAHFIKNNRIKVAKKSKAVKRKR